MTAPVDRVLYGAPLADGSTPFWLMPTIWAAAQDKPAVSVSIDSLNIMDDVVWFGGPKDVQPTIRLVTERARDIFNADLSYPIVMTKAGEVLDGAHRIARAYLEGRQVMNAVVLDDWPPPDGTIAT